jgi:hypothetical protein
VIPLASSRAQAGGARERQRERGREKTREKARERKLQ